MLWEAFVFQHFTFSVKIYTANSQNLCMKCYMLEAQWVGLFYLHINKALIKLKAKRTDLNSEQCCFRLWHFKALILAVDYFTCWILFQPVSFWSGRVLVHFWQMHCVKGLGSALSSRSGSERLDEGEAVLKSLYLLLAQSDKNNYELEPLTMSCLLFHLS